MAKGHSHQHNTVKNIKVAFLLNLSFTILEVIGGLLTNSIAILSDALHDLGDSVSLGVAWYLEKYSQKQADHNYTYGYRRFSLLGAFLISIVLMAGSLIVLSEAFRRLINPESTNAPGMILLAVIGILVNGAAVLRLQNDKGVSAQAVSWHLLEDVLGWVAVLVVGIVMALVDLPILDPVLSIALAFYVLYNVINNLKRALKVFLQAIPDAIDPHILEKRLTEIEGVLSQHHTHMWTLDGEHHVLTTHLVVDNSATLATFSRIKNDVWQLASEYDFEHVTIQIEHEGEECNMR